MIRPPAGLRRPLCRRSAPPPSNVAAEALERRTLLAAGLYFQAKGATTGTELYSFDGTTASLTAQIVPGSGDSGPSNFAIYKGYLFFSATTAAHGNELWRYDGTAATRITDINPGAAHASPSNLTVFNGKLYFTASDASTGFELWSYNDTGNVASRAADIRAGAMGSSPSSLTVLGNKLYFGADNGSDGFELWSYSGSGAPTMVEDFNPGPSSGFAGAMTAFDGRLYFAAADHNVTISMIELPANELYSYNPTTNTFALAGESAATPPGNPQGIIVFNNKVYTTVDDDGTFGRELYVHDPAQPTANLTRVTNVNGAGAANPSGFCVFNNKLYFSAFNGNDFELYSYNPAAMPPVTRINIAPDGGGAQSSSPESLVVFNNLLYFGANARDGFGKELFSLDAANVFTRRTNINTDNSVSSGSSSPRGMIVYDPALAGGKPLANNDTFATDRLRSRPIDVLANDVDLDLDPLTVTQVNGAAIAVGATLDLPSGARVTRNADGTLTYDPDGAFNGLAVNTTAPDTFAYTISDGTNTSTAAVNMTVSNFSDLVVNTLADTIDSDPNVTSLREAVIANNLLLGERVIVLPVGTYNLSIDGPAEDATLTGDLDLTSQTSRIIIRGNGQTSLETTVRGVSLDDRGFHVKAGTVVEFENFTIRQFTARDDGAITTRSLGGGVLNAGDLTLNDAAFVLNEARGTTGARGNDGFRDFDDPGLPIFAPTAGLPGLPARGAGVYSTGKLTIVDTLFNLNVATGGTGGRGGDALTLGNGDGPQDSRSRGAVGGLGGVGEGGAVYATGPATVVNGRFVLNDANGGIGGRGGNGATLRSDDNSGGKGGTGGTARGGGYYAVGAATFEFTSFTENEATGGTGGAGGTRGAQPMGPYGGSGGDGGTGGVGRVGGLYADTLDKQVSVRSSLLNLNAGRRGAGGTGGTNSGSAVITGDPGANGTADGGAVGVFSGGLSLVNSTLSENVTDGRGGGIYAPVGAGILTLTNNTIAFNVASQQGGGVFTVNGVASANTIFSNNTGSAAAPQFSGAFARGALNNILGVGAGATGISNNVNGNRVGTVATPVNPMLQSLADNGGATFTHKLHTGSVALDGGDNASAAAAGLTTDQRGSGFPRVLDAADAGTDQTVDVGAFEAHPTVQNVANQTTPEDTPKAVNFNVGDAAPGFASITASSSNPIMLPDSALAVSGSGATRTLTMTPAPDLFGTATITITVTAADGQTAVDTFVLTVTGVNDAPRLNPIADVGVAPGSGMHTVMLGGIAAGPPNENQAITVTALSEDPGYLPNPTVVYTSPNATGTLQFNAPATPGLVKVIVTVTDNGTPAQSFSQSFNIVVGDLTGPRVTAVYVDSSAWQPAFRQYLQDTGIGSSSLGYLVPAGAAQLDELPWTNLDRVHVRFNENVLVDAADLAIRGVNVATYVPAAFNYDPATFTATWSLAGGTTIANDKVLLDLNGDAGGVVDTLGVPGNALDGEWVNGAGAFPSGNNAAGGDFRFQINVLPGDVNQSGGIVNSLDVQQVRIRQFTSPANPGPVPNTYTAFFDVDGSAFINALDVQRVRIRQFTQLPAGDPALRAPAAHFGIAPWNFGFTRDDADEETR